MSDSFRALDDCFLVRNDKEAPCQTCGLVHDFLTVTGRESCGIPAVFTEHDLRGVSGVWRGDPARRARTQPRLSRTRDK